MMAYSTDDLLTKAEEHFRSRGYLRTAGRLRILRRIKTAKDVNVSSLIAPIIDDAVSSYTFKSMQNGQRNPRPLLEEALSSSMRIQAEVMLPKLDIKKAVRRYLENPVDTDKLDHLWAVFDPVSDDASYALGAVPLLVSTYREVWGPVRDILVSCGRDLEEEVEMTFSINSAVDSPYARSDFGYVYDRCITMADFDIAGGKVRVGELSIPVSEFILWPRIMELTISVLMDILVCIAAREEVISRQ